MPGSSSHLGPQHPAPRSVPSPSHSQRSSQLVSPLSPWFCLQQSVPLLSMPPAFTCGTRNAPKQDFFRSNGVCACCCSGITGVIELLSRV